MRILATGFAASLVLGLAAMAAGQEQPEPAAAGTQPTRADPLDPWTIYAGGQFEEVFIDEDFKLYKVRTYQGLVPGRDDKDGGSQPAPAEPGKAGKIKVDRVGFEQRELFSRVFVVTDRSVTPWVYDNFVQAHSTPGIPYQVYVELAGAQIPVENDRRALDTRRFNTPVATVEGTEMKTGARIVVTLKREARYLPVQVGNTLYIDVER